MGLSLSLATFNSLHGPCSSNNYMALLGVNTAPLLPIATLKYDSEGMKTDDFNAKIS